VVLFALDQRVPEYAALLDALKREIDDTVGLEPTEIYVEYLDITHFSRDADHDVFASYLQAKYTERSIDVVLALTTNAVAFLAARRDRLFVDVPVIFSALETSPYLANPPNGSYAVVLPFAPAQAVELARRLQPNLEHVFVVEDGTDAARTKRERLHASLTSFDDLSIEYVTGVPLEDVLERTRHLPPNSMILFDAVADEAFADPTGPVRQVAEAANAPVYTARAGYIGQGVVGGAFAPLEQVGIEIARRAARILAGQPPGANVVQVAAINVVDAAVMSRWGLEQARLPVATALRNAAPSIWKLYQGWIITLLLLVALQFALIVALLIQSVSRRHDRLALTEAAHRFRLARIAGQVGFWQWDPATDRIAVEPELREFLGHDDEQTGPIAWRDHIYAKDLPGVLKAARNHMRGRTPYFEIQHRVLDRGSNVRWFLSRGQVLRDRDNKPIRMVGTAIDITERKRNEDERARAQLQLQEQRVELAHLSRAAATGALSGALAHELKQPLSAILSNAQAGRKYLGKRDVDRDELASILADIESDGRRAGDVIHHLRNLLHRAEEDCELVRLDTIVDEVLHLVHSDLVGRNVRVVLGPMASLPSILADRVQVQQVVLNLLNNAADAMSGTEPRDRKIVISASANDDRVRLTVADSGCGFGAQNPDRIFKPFVTTKRNGLGLGLSISRSIVETHGGRIWAENNASGGASLHMEFPAATRSKVA
jgi:PAS domain S-box-containing protein